MSIVALAWQNFRHNVKQTLALVLSLSFTILIFFNFLSLIDANVIDTLGASILENVEAIIQIITFILVCFMTFFIWYSTNLFLAKRKKEIGIYIFMGLTNQRIAKLYALETIFIALAVLIIGLVSGILFAQLFQLILFRLSDLSIDLQIGFSFTSLFHVAIVYLIIYSLFIFKGYCNIVRSSVLDMITATRQTEYIKEPTLFLCFKAILGCGFLGVGYALAIEKAGMETINNAVIAVIFVIIGIYFFFGGLLPVLFHVLSKRKLFLYHKERILWINQVMFRMRKNYRTYAMVAILMVCSITALASGFAMKDRYNNMVHFRNTYTFQILSTKQDQRAHFQDLIEQENEISYASELSLLQLDPTLITSSWNASSYGLVSYHDMQTVAEQIGFPFPFAMPDDDEYIHVDKKTLLTLVGRETNQSILLQGQHFSMSDVTDTPYLGYLQEITAFYMVNDHVYEQLQSLGSKYFLYNYKIADPANFSASLVSLQEDPSCMGLIKIDPADDEYQWIRILYSLCIFMFLVFVLASGSILFMKLYNDAIEEKERILTLQKLGIASSSLKKAIQQELRFAYGAPLMIMALSSYFSIRALGNLLQSDVTLINVIAVLLICVLFACWYKASLWVYQKMVGIH